MPDDSKTAELYQVIAVNYKTGIRRVIATNETFANSDAAIRMAVARRGVDEEYYRMVPQAAGVEIPECGTYRHYKGGYYHLAWLARREHDGEWMCCYAKTGTLERYVRPASEWSEIVDNQGTRRFTPA